MGEVTNATAFVRDYCTEYSLSKSAAWSRLNSLKRMGLVVAGSERDRGCKVALTNVGKLVLGGVYVAER